MTTKRLRKLLRATLTRLHETSLARSGQGFENIGQVYQNLKKVRMLPATGKSNADWWRDYSTLAATTNTLYGVGVKHK